MMVFASACRFLLEQRCRHQHPDSDSQNQQSTDPLHDGDDLLILMMVVACDRMLGQMDNECDCKQRGGVSDSTGEPHDQWMPESTSFAREVDKHCGLPVSGLERVDCPKKKRQAEGHFMGVFVHDWKHREWSAEAALVYQVTLRGRR